MKHCSRCGEMKPQSEFGVRTNGKVQAWCRACHRVYQRAYHLRHQEYYAKLQAQRVTRNRSMLRKAKSVPCADCRVVYPYYVMDFDHRPGEVKCFNLANVAGQTRISLARLEAEIAKCDVVCANCHRIRTHERRKTKLEQQKSCCSSAVEHFIGNEEVLGSIPNSSSGIARLEGQSGGQPPREALGPSKE